jgi:hypothetical protein
LPFATVISMTAPAGAVVVVAGGAVVALPDSLPSDDPLATLVVVTAAGGAVVADDAFDVLSSLHAATNKKAPSTSATKPA